MTYIVLAVLVVFQFAFGCKYTSDCSYLGYCDLSDSTCICNYGWYGDKCDIINLTSTINYNTDGYHDSSGLATWDGSPIIDKKSGKYHLYITVLTENCTPTQWLSNSIIVHVVSATTDPLGPYIYSDIAINVYNDSYNITHNWDGLSVYNPMIIADPFQIQTMYYLFYTATTLSNGIHLNCSINKPSMNITLRNNQNIGYAYSTSLYGPWIKSLSNPILSPRKYNNSLWDSLYVCNPDPYYLSNGTMILIYKGKSAQNNGNGGMNTGIAIVNASNGNTWNSSYIRFNSYFDDAGDCEDGYFWEQINNGPSYHMLYHCKCNGTHSYSTDLINWIYGKQQPWCNISLNNGTKINFKRRERPWIIFNDKNNQNATYLYNAVQPSNTVSFNFVQKL